MDYCLELVEAMLRSGSCLTYEGCVAEVNGMGENMYKMMLNMFLPSDLRHDVRIDPKYRIDWHVWMTPEDKQVQCDPALKMTRE